MDWGTILEVGLTSLSMDESIVHKFSIWLWQNWMHPLGLLSLGFDECFLGLELFRLDLSLRDFFLSILHLRNGSELLVARCATVSSGPRSLLPLKHDTLGSTKDSNKCNNSRHLFSYYFDY